MGERHRDVGGGSVQERGEGGVGNLRLVSLLATSPLVCTPNLSDGTIKAYRLIFAFVCERKGGGG